MIFNKKFRWCKKIKRVKFLYNFIIIINDNINLLTQKKYKESEKNIAVENCYILNTAQLSHIRLVLQIYSSFDCGI